jgi:uncharacterized protein YuzE
MMQARKITYDREANALYVYLRDVAPVRQKVYADDVILDLAADGGLVGIEVLDPGADLTPLVREFDLDPHLLEVLDRVRSLIPDTHKQLVLT